VTTGVRFHPFESLVSAGIKMTAVAALGAPAVSVVVFEILLNASSMFSHGNVSVPLAVDAAARKVLVTPDMHRVHHSTLPSEHNMNFGFNLSLWDRVFRTYRAQPARGHEQMAIGLGYDVRQACAITEALLIPFTGRRPSVTSR
jgi:sterol desaturase/sphingolipid hydroxylase (fatty acid hydroxylase superfamily)